MKTLAYGGMAVIVLSMTLGTKLGVEDLALLDLFVGRHGNRRFQVFSGRCLEEFFSTLLRNRSLWHRERQFLVRPQRRGLPHSAVAEILVIVDQCLVGQEDDDPECDQK
jgi:hypothetical protein